MKQKLLEENIDYIINQDGDLVFTESYLLARGHCCKSGCKNCPYGYKNSVDPLIPTEFQSGWSNDYETDDDEESD